MLMMFDGGSVASTREFVILISYGMITREVDWLIEGQYDLQFTTQMGQEHVKMTDMAVAMLGLRIKMDCSIPINSIPRCSAIAEG